MFLVLPFLCFFFLVLLFRKVGETWPAAVIGTAVTWGLLLTAMTEVLSVFHLITFPVLCLSWFAAGLAAAVAYCLLPRKEEQVPEAVAPRSSVFAIWLVVGISLLIVAPVGVTALVAPPHTWDSLTYHLVRVLYWAQNQSVAHYPTNELRHLYMQPMSEFVMLHFHVLSGTDVFANSVQWLSLIGVTVTALLIAQELGAGRPGQLLAAAICATIPMGILQASSSRNDVVAAFWLACFVYYGLRWKAKQTPLCILAAGVSLGLALLTKAMAYLYAPPLILLIGVGGLKSLLTTYWRDALLAGAAVLLINSGHFVRNLMLFGNPLKPSNEALQYNVSYETYAPEAIASGVIRNAAMHFVTTPFPAVNQFVLKVVEGAHRQMGIDANDPRTTFLPDVEAFHVPPPEHARFEEHASCLVHVVLFLFAVALCLTSPQLRSSRILVLYPAVLLLGFVLFSGYVKFMMSGSLRYQYALLVLAAPYTAVVLAERMPRLAPNALTAVLLVLSLPYSFTNLTRPLLGEESILLMDRTDMFFFNTPETREYLEKLYDCYLGATEFLRKGEHEQIGVIADDYEYPFWVLYPEPLEEGGRIEHVGMDHPYARRMVNSEDFKPTAVVWIDTERLQGKRSFPWPDTWKFGKTVFRSAWSSDAVRVYVRKQY